MNDFFNEQTLEAARNYVNEIVKFPGESGQFVLSQHLGNWRLRNKITVLASAQKWLKAKGIDINTISPDIFMPLIENAGSTQNPILLNMYANLLVAYLSPDPNILLHASFSKVMHHLSETDAILINTLYKGIKYGNFDYTTKSLTLDAACNLLKMKENQMLMSFQNLWRLGLCEHKTDFFQLGEFKQIIFTGFGWSFINACHRMEG